MKKFFKRIGNAIARFRYGRYGQDELNLVLDITALVFLLASYLFGLFLPHVPVPQLIALGLSLVLILLTSVRALSKNLPKRRRELERYYRIKTAPRRARQLRKNKKRDRKTHLYFKCPKCRSVLRVPRGKGEIVVTCPRCGTRTEKST